MEEKISTGSSFIYAGKIFDIFVNIAYGIEMKKGKHNQKKKLSFPRKCLLLWQRNAHMDDKKN